MTPIKLVKRMFPYVEARRDYLYRHLAAQPNNPQADSNRRELEALMTLCQDVRRELRKERTGENA